LLIAFKMAFFGGGMSNAQQIAAAQQEMEAFMDSYHR
jgi:hypothetical protein